MVAIMWDFAAHWSFASVSYLIAMAAYISLFVSLSVKAVHLIELPISLVMHLLQHLVLPPCIRSIVKCFLTSFNRNIVSHCLSFAALETIFLVKMMIINVVISLVCGTSSSPNTER